MNALAHAIEALYAPGANPVAEGAALRAAELFAERARPADRGLATTWRWPRCWAATPWARRGPGVHHALCQTIVRVLGTPHAPTNAVMLPHSLRFMAGRAPGPLGRLAGRSGEDDARRAGGGPGGAARGADHPGRAGRRGEATSTPWWTPRWSTPACRHARASGAAMTSASCWRRPGPGSAGPCSSDRSTWSDTRRTDGEEGHEWQGTTTLLLTTTGRKSGEERTTPLIYQEHDGDYLVVASKGGADEPPAWYRNLQERARRGRCRSRATCSTPTARTPATTRSPRCGAR